jgi:hypothetical protein
LATRTIRLDNKTDRALRLCVEPIPYHYDVPAGAIAELRGLDPADDVLDLIVQTDPEGASVSIFSCKDVTVFVSGRRLATVPDA